jgi:hypothetical protein
MENLARQIAIYNGQKGTAKQVERVIKNFKGQLWLMEQFAKGRIKGY